MVKRLSKAPQWIACLLISVFYSQTLLSAYEPLTEIQPNPEITDIGSIRAGAKVHNLNNFPVSFHLLSGNSKQNADLKFAIEETAPEKEDIGGPTQPEMTSFKSVNSNNMVDLFSGDFSYNIPLLDVGGYPVNLFYKSGITMDQEASWVGLGWNINPGTITRNLRGIPDDFDGKNDTIQKTTSIKENKTIGGDIGLDLEIVGVPLAKFLDSLNIGLGSGIGIFHNNYRGWGIEHSFNASISAGKASMGHLTAGLSVNNNTQDGLTISPSLSIQLEHQYEANNITTTGALSVGGGFSYNSRSGLIANLSTGINLSKEQSKNGSKEQTNMNLYSSYLSFVSPSYNPSVSIPFTNNQFTFTAKLGGEATVLHPNVYLKGYVTKQYIAPEDVARTFPAYGYLYYQDANDNPQALLDFNREKDIIYRDKPEVPNIAVPSYTYDLFCITGEGSGGMFRACRGDIGFVHDPYVTTKNHSDAASADFGFGDLFHGGLDFNVNNAITTTGTWTEGNPLSNTVRFKQNDSVFEAAYFRNPGEKSINTGDFYKNIGGDDVVTAQLYQAGPSISSTNYFQHWKNQTQTNVTTLLNPSTDYKTKRDKRSQVISYLNAAEASRAGLDTVIYNYGLNIWGQPGCSNAIKTEPRVNSFRKANHISQIDVLNSDGRKYVYGLPVYNLIKEDVTFAADSAIKNNKKTGFVKYDQTDASPNNHHGNDNYFQKETTSAYAHSFLLTAILSPDYVDVTGNGISQDDLGDAIKFNYSKIAGKDSAFGWRTPYVADSATYNEGLQTYVRDDKGNYIYGEKEMWYLNSVESKNMIAIFTLEDRSDLRSATEMGDLTDSTKAKRLKQIDLYSKSDYIQNGANAKPIKTVHFFYTYDLCKGVNGNSSFGKLTLKKIWFTYNGNNKGMKNPYLFFYNTTNPNYTNTAYDRWGNYKGPLQNPGSTQQDLITNAEYPYTLQDNALANSNAAAWTMDSIVLPSTGSIKVGYESDDYAYVQNKRAMQMFNVVGLSHEAPATFYGGSADNNVSNDLYEHQSSLDSSKDNLYVSIRVNQSLTNKKEAYQEYLEGFQKIYFKLKVQMPPDQWGSGYEYIPVYADLNIGSIADSTNYGILNEHGNSNIIWISLKGINLAGDDSGDFSPLAKAAIQFLRLNLPSKAYPGYETDDNLDLGDAVHMIGILGSNIFNAFTSFDKLARENKWAIQIDTARTLARLDNPIYKKYGGGLRVKCIKIYDNWKKMTETDSVKESVYGQIYDYTTVKNINGVDTRISSGVANWEPMMGGEENPFRIPLEYIEKVAPLAPVTMGYTELPLGETFFPAPSVGYSQVRVRSIHTTNIKSANGYEETKFYTAYDFPTITDNSMFTPDTKKRYKTTLRDFLRLNTYHYLSMSQGFKIELNDMNGKIKSQATYAETDSIHPIASTQYYYHVDDQNAEVKHLKNTVSTVNAQGLIDTTTTIGKDVELMTDMRQQKSITEGIDYSVNVDLFIVFLFPIVIPSNIPMPQREETRFQSVATTKVIQRFGILDSVVVIDKGSKVSTDNLLYDNETGDVLLTRTRNEFNDTLYNFTYPSHWAYSGMGPAYQNIDAVFDGVKITNGLLQASSKYPGMLNHIESGDEFLAEGEFKNGVDSSISCGENNSCPEPTYAENTDTMRIWAVDAKRINPSTTLGTVFIDRNGNPFTGHNLRLKIIKSGHRNLSMTPVGTVTMLNSPIRTLSGKLQLVIDSNKNILSTTAASFNDTWRISDARKPMHFDYSCTCGPLKELFDYLIASHRLLTAESDNVTVTSLVHDASNSGYSINIDDCNLLSNNRNGLFYALTEDEIGSIYRAKIGNSIIKITSDNSSSIHFYSLQSQSCGTDNKVHYQDNSNLLVRYEIYNNTSTAYTYAFIGCSQGYYGYTLRAHWDTCVWARDGKIYPPIGISGIDTVRGGVCTGAPTPCSNDNIYLAIETCDTCSGYTCLDPVLDTTLNPYAYGLLGNWRSQKSYVYYGNRREFNPLSPTNIRKNGVIQNFFPYWSFGSTYLTATSDTSTYVWNSQSTLYNKKGFEIENKDPLGRYNAGAYGYNESLPIDVVQNSQYKDQFFDGFEDYSYTTQNCSVNCPVPKNINFVTDGTSLTDSISHSGKYSLKINTLDSSVQLFQILDSSIIESQKINVLRDSIGVDTIVSPLGTGLLVSRYGTEQVVNKYSGYIQSIVSGYYTITSNIPHTHYNGGGIGYWLTVGGPGGVTDQTLTDATTQLSVTFYLTAGEKIPIEIECQSGSYFTDTLSLTWRSACVSLEEVPTKNLYQSNNFDNSVTYEQCRSFLGIKTDSSSLIPSFRPTQGNRMVFSAWVKEEKDCLCQNYDSNAVSFTFSRSGNPDLILTFKPNGNIIEGWQRYDTVITVPSDATSMRLSLKSTGNNPVYFDDVRMYPFNGNMKSFVYDPISLRLMAELDENNYATFYEYDNDGTLIRVKKETERGIQTIKETRSSLSQLHDQ